ncbi:MAG: dihydroxyacetone kinase phosphoryl donor subunit DhaM [Pauljensenia sp.]
MSARVGLVIVSHSDLLARGVVEVASQMAPDVDVVAAGGTDDLSLGTSFDRVGAAVEQVLSAVGEGAGAGAVILTDLGSATLTAESVVEFADEPGRLVLADAPLVEGAVAAAVRAQLGDTVDEVAAAARGAGQVAGTPDAGTDTTTADTAPPGIPVVRADVAESSTLEEELATDATVGDPAGLHARPAAQLARLAGGFDAEITVNGADAGSVLEVMALGVRHGDRVHLTATGPEAHEALTALVDLLESAS